MKKIYFLLLSFTIFSYFCVIAFSLQQATNNSIPTVKSLLKITEKNNAITNAKLIKTLDDYAKKEGIQLHKVIFSINRHEKKVKTIYTFGGQGYQYTDKHANYPIYFKNSTAFKDHSPLGIYYLTEDVPQAIITELSKIATIEVVKPTFIERYGALFLPPFGILFLLLVLLTILSHVLYKVSLLKSFGIYELLGLSKVKKILPSYIAELSLSAVFFIVVAVLYPITIPMLLTPLCIMILMISLLNIATVCFLYYPKSIIPIINGKKPYRPFFYLSYGIKILILVLTIISLTNALTSHYNLKIEKKDLNIWQKFSAYYTFDFTGQNIVLGGTQKDDKRFYELITTSEQNGAILSYHNANFPNVISNNNSVAFENTSQMTVNNNFLMQIKIVDITGNRIKNLANYTLLIPENKKKYQKEALEQAKADIIGHHNNAIQINTNDINLIYTKSNQKIFNFNSFTLTKAYSINPTILVLPKTTSINQVKDMKILMSSGAFIAQNSQQLQNFIRTNQYESNLEISAITDRALISIEQNKSSFLLNLFTSILSILIYTAVTFYQVMLYTILNEKKLFLLYSFGKTNLERFGIFVLTTLAIGICFIISLFPFVSLKYLSYMCLLLLIELITLVISLMYSDKRQRIQLLKKE